MADRKSRRAYWITAGIITVILILFFLLLDPGEIWNELRQADWRILLLAWVFLVAGLGLLSLRWRYLLRGAPSYPQVLKSDGMSFLTTSLTPVPAPALRVVTLSRIAPVSATLATSGMVVDRLLEQIMRVTCLLLALIVYARLLVSTASMVGNLVAIVLGLVLVFWMIRNPAPFISSLSRLTSRLPGLSEKQAHSFISNLVQGFVLAGTPLRFFIALLLSIVMWGCFFCFQILIIYALGLELNFRESAAIALAVLAIAPPSAPAMPGVYHGVLVAGLTLLGILDIATLTAYAIISHALQLAYWLPLGVWGVLKTDLRLTELFNMGRVRASAAGDHPADYQAGQEEQGDPVDESRPAI
jgi:uncharacterized protein (TIRG00374 family)